MGKSGGKQVSKRAFSGTTDEHTHCQLRLKDQLALNRFIKYLPTTVLNLLFGSFFPLIV